MAPNDDMLREREQTWRRFTRVMAVIVVVAIIVLGAMRLFLV
jgi:Tfp pilus assembly protein PilX